MATNLTVPTQHMRVFAVPLAVVVLLATACSHSSSGPGAANVGSSRPSGQSSSRSSRSGALLAFSVCMRSHGARQWPDPGQTDLLLPQAGHGAFGVSSAKLWPAVNACRRLLPAGQGGWYPRSDTPRVLRGMREFAACMRAHGISHWPDPASTLRGASPSLGLAPTTPRARRRTTRCTNASTCCRPTSPCCAGTSVIRLSACPFGVGDARGAAYSSPSPSKEGYALPPSRDVSPAPARDAG